MNYKKLKKMAVSALAIATLMTSIAPVYAQTAELNNNANDTASIYATRSPEAGIKKSTYLYSKASTTSTKVASVKAGDFGVLFYVSNDSYYKIVNGVKWAYMQVSRDGKLYAEGWIQAKFVDDVNGVLE